MSKIRNGLNQILNILTGGSFLVMVGLTIWQVAARYVFKNPSVWSEELVSYMFAWASLFGACLVTSERGHMNIPIIVEKFSATGQKIFAVAGEAISFLFSIIILVYGGSKITNLAMGQRTSALGVAVGVFYIVLPIAGVLNGLYSILNIADILKIKAAGNPAAEKEVQ